MKPTQESFQLKSALETLLRDRSKALLNGVELLLLLLLLLVVVVVVVVVVFFQSTYINHYLTKSTHICSLLEWRKAD